MVEGERDLAMTVGVVRLIEVVEAVAEMVVRGGLSEELAGGAGNGEGLPVVFQRSGRVTDVVGEFTQVVEYFGFMAAVSSFPGGFERVLDVGARLLDLANSRYTSPRPFSALLST
ncbi:hypothetical protein H4W33_002573 [Kibdelosporangium phytohabitans]|uniref:Uncharacterized protein n=1 Tax=Kibdelosporangium phytohabitans TaxID=860235 RepID=A0A0N9HXI1_9PSEU|nr:hypothetical protein [Kibdelosporangium phytohabitans]ALG12074.1 hypothetical protein AOZ06_39055 [Kibdelosporangium phytohabitans]MBE1463561.1 hypothetical protein [Kibdelosporangium phytohabitans]